MSVFIQVVFLVVMVTAVIEVSAKQHKVRPVTKWTGWKCYGTGMERRTRKLRHAVHCPHQRRALCYKQQVHVRPSGNPSCTAVATTTAVPAPVSTTPPPVRPTAAIDVTTAAGAVTASVATTPLATTPIPTTPVPTTPVGTTPVRTTPLATTPVLTTPVGTTPVRTTPLVTTPVATTTVASAPCLNYSNPINAVLHSNTTATPMASFKATCSYGVGGLAVLGDELFVACVASTGAESLVQVYSASTGYNFTRSFPISVAAGDGFSACTSCAYLYLADHKRNKIYRVNSKDGLDNSSWPASLAGASSAGDSITSDSDCNLVVASRQGPPAMYVFSANGLMIDNVSLSDGTVNRIQSVYRAVRAPNGYVVAYRDTSGNYQLGLFDFSGNILATAASGTFSSVSSVVVNNGFVLAADPVARRIALLDSSLGHVRTFVSVMLAYHMLVDGDKQIMYVANDVSNTVNLYILSG